MRSFLTEYFRPTRIERLGALLLSIICIVCFSLNYAIPLFKKEAPPQDFQTFQLQIERFLTAEIDSSFELSKPPFSKRGKSKAIALQPFTFDPNSLDKAGFIQLGLSDKTAQTIINYRKKGGKFYKEEDFKRIYGLRSEDYERLEKYILFEKPGSNRERTNQGQLADYQQINKDTSNNSNKTIFQKSNKSNFDKVKKPIQVDINLAGAEEWEKLYGIGPYFSKKILKFREALGGFSSVEQLAETYHLPDSTFQNIKPYLKISPITRKLNINQADLNELKAHPYINYKQAKGIINYRKQHGSFQGFEQFSKIGGALKESDFEKLKPYLNFQIK